MDTHSDSEGDIDWDTGDEEEIKGSSLPSFSCMTMIKAEETRTIDEASSSSGSSNWKLIQQFVHMGFCEKLVSQVIMEDGNGNAESILETLLTYSVLENGHDRKLDKLDEEDNEACNSVSDVDESFLAGFSDSDSYSSDNKKIPESDEDKKVLFLTRMGYPVEEASLAVKRCGPDSSVADLTDFLSAAQMAREDDFYSHQRVKPHSDHRLDFMKHKKRKLMEDECWKQKKVKRAVVGVDEDMAVRLPNPMIGFGLPGEPYPVTQRNIPSSAVAPPYFFYENVALAPKGVWDTISRFLYDIEPEFIDSKYFCATARKRGYIHNLPIKDRFPILPLPALTVHEAIPITKKWWPPWDTRTKLNCLQTCIGSARLTDRIRKVLEENVEETPPRVQKYVLEESRKWNLVWVGRNKLAPLEPDEIEILLGFPKNHTRGGGISRTDRYKSLGNSFQVDTVAYQLSVLKGIYPGGMTVLSLFSGIGGAEVALHRLGIQMKKVVSVEISETNQNIMRSWWEQTNQSGTLIHISDVQELSFDRLGHLVSSIGGFDLVIGGSPCNNLAGSNRVSRDGLEGKESSLFFHYYRILDSLKSIMAQHPHPSPSSSS